MQQSIKLSMTASMNHGYPSVIDTMSRLGFMRILDIPVIPVANLADIYYDRRISLYPGPKDWFLRSYGTQFNLIGFNQNAMKGFGYRHYSLGWGLVGARQSPGLLLAQASAEEEDILRELRNALFKMLGDLTSILTSTFKIWHGRLYLLFAADVGSNFNTNDDIHACGSS